MKKFLLIALISFTAMLKAQTQAYLDANNVKALILNRNDMFWDATGSMQARYEVPKNSGKHCNFASSVWIGGFDAGNQLHLAGMTYRQTGFDFWPGPLDTINGVTTTSVSNSYDKIWKVTTDDLNALLSSQNFSAATTDIVSWPGNGDVSQGYSRSLAPFHDVNSDGSYSASTGDYPKIKGDQMLWYVVNDKLNAHAATGGVPLGIEMQVSAYSYSCPAVLAAYPVLNNTTFYEYKIINRSANSYSTSMIGIWSDADIGYHLNDFIACDPAARQAFMYNATPTDAQYGNYPPILSYKILQGPTADTNDGLDNNGDGSVDEPMEDTRFDNFMYYNNNVGSFPPHTTNPSIAQHYYSYMRSIWKNNTPLRADSAGYVLPQTASVTAFAYPGNPQTNTGWTEYSKNNLPGDRRFIIGNGPITIKPGSHHILEFAVITTFDSTAGGHKNISKAKLDGIAVENFHKLASKPSCMVTGIKELEETKTELYIAPNPANERISITCVPAIKHAEASIFNSLGQEVIRQQVNDQNGNIDVSELPAGVYFVIVKNNTQKAISKLIKN